MAYGLTRLLRTEDDWSDSLCFLAELDPEPLRSALRMAQGTITVRREVRVKTGRGTPTGRVDFVVLLDGVARALMEMKLGAGAHGEQFAAYNAWAEAEGIPAADRHLVGPNADPISDGPRTWSRRLTFGSLLDSWNSSSDDLARQLAARAHQQLVMLEAEATGPANQASIALSDALRLRRLARLTRDAAPEGTEFNLRQHSKMGAPNICAWRETEDGYVVAEIQRLQPRRGTNSPFEIRIMVQTPQATSAANGSLADRHQKWLARNNFVQHAGPSVRALVKDPEDDGFKKKPGAKGHPQYYGYEGGGHGSSVVLQDTVDLNDMVTAFSAVLEYLTTYPKH